MAFLQWKPANRELNNAISEKIIGDFLSQKSTPLAARLCHTQATNPSGLRVVTDLDCSGTNLCYENTAEIPSQMAKEENCQYQQESV